MRVALLVFACLSLAGAARAQDCDDEVVRGPVEVTPSVGAQAVTLDAPVIVLYSAGYFGPEGGPGDPPETLIRVGVCPLDTGCGVPCDLDAEASPVPGTVQVIGDRLFFQPDDLLDERRQYVGSAGGLDGALDFRFCAGRALDARPPAPPQFVEATPDVSGESCALPDGGRRIGLRYRPSTDDGPLGSIEYLLFLTRGAGVDEPQLRDRFRNTSTDEALLRLLLTQEESAEPVCVRVLAVDGVGSISEPTPEECVDPLTAAAFQPLCAVDPGAARHGRGSLLLAAAALAIGLRVVRRSR